MRQKCDTFQSRISFCNDHGEKNVLKKPHPNYRCVKLCWIQLYCTRSPAAVRGNEPARIQDRTRESGRNGTFVNTYSPFHCDVCNAKEYTSVTARSSLHFALQDMTSTNGSKISMDIYYPVGYDSRWKIFPLFQTFSFPALTK